MATTNDITGDELVSKGLSEQGKQRHEQIFGPRWKKHYGTGDCPVDKDATVEVETYTAQRRFFRAGDIDWKLVKWYRVKN